MNLSSTANNTVVTWLSSSRQQQDTSRCNRHREPCTSFLFIDSLGVSTRMLRTPFMFCFLSFAILTKLSMIAQPLAIYSDRFCDDCYIRFPVMLQTNNNKKNIFRIWHREKKLARLLFDFGAVKITDDDCEQQVPNVALSLQQLTTPVARRRSCSVYNSCGLTPTRIGGCINIYIFICQVHVFCIWNTNISPGHRLGGSECGNRISDANFLTVFRNNYGSVVLSFRDMTTKRTTEDGPTTATIAYLALNPL